MFTPLFALIAPFVLWPVEQVFPYPHIVEELVKAVIIYQLLGISNLSTKIKLAIVVGVLFALSESVLHLFNVFATGSLKTFWLRLFYTIPLHSLTSVTILLSAVKSRWGLILGLTAAIFIHYLFNLYILLYI